MVQKTEVLKKAFRALHGVRVGAAELRTATNQPSSVRDLLRSAQRRHGNMNSKDERFELGVLLLWVMGGAANFTDLAREVAVLTGTKERPCVKHWVRQILSSAVERIATNNPWTLHMLSLNEVVRVRFKRALWTSFVWRDQEYHQETVRSFPGLLELANDPTWGMEAALKSKLIELADKRTSQESKWNAMLESENQGVVL